MENRVKLYKDKPDKYFTGLRTDIITLVPQGKNKILEIGCASGRTLLKLKEMKKAIEVVGVDLVDLNIRNLDNYIIGNIEDVVLPYPEGYFDIIICTDVLEHLIDPWKVVGKLKYYLKKRGIIIASIPNIRNYKVLFDLVIRGDFKYVDAGILDKTHLRFFCKKNIIELFRVNGLLIEKVFTNLDFGTSTKRKIFRILNLFTFKFLENFFATQFIIKAIK